MEAGRTEDRPPVTESPVLGLSWRTFGPAGRPKLTPWLLASVFSFVKWQKQILTRVCNEKIDGKCFKSRQ